MSTVSLLQGFLQSSEYVGSYLELYTTIYGLKAGEQFFALLWSIGAIKAVFAAIAVMTAIEAFQKGGTEGGWMFVRTIGMRFVGLWLVLLLCVWPISTLDVGLMKYDPPATITTINAPLPDVTVTSATTQQEHGRRGFNINDPAQCENCFDIRVPLMIRLAMMTGHGINRAATKVFPDRLSMRMLDQGLATMKLDDPAMLSELAAFNTQCYIPAVNKMQTFWRGGNLPNDLYRNKEDYGVDDLNWMGSQILLKTEGLYKPCSNTASCGSSLQASNPVNDFVWNDMRDGQPIPGTASPDFRPMGFPYCDEWWIKLRAGLYAQHSGMLDEINNILSFNNLALLVPGGQGLSAAADYTAEDEVVRIVLSRSSAHELFSDDLTYYTGKIKQDAGVMASVGKSVTDAAVRAAEWGGTMVSTPFSSIEQTAMNNMAPIVQSVVLMALYMLAPFVAIFSGFRWQVVFTYAVLILSVISWQIWWTFIMWVDSNMLMSMYPDDGSITSYIEEAGTKRMMLDRILGGAAVFAPGIWTFILSVAGWKGAEAMSRMVGSFQTAASKEATSAARGAETLAKMAMPSGPVQTMVNIAKKFAKP
jgi:TraG-like protein, N-terminal region